MSAAPALAIAREQLVHVVQGEYAVADRPGTVFNTILGSCVATCLHDPVARIGGMNHFLVPGDAETTSDSVKYGVNAMELLINALLQRGAMRNRLEAKLFGGASVVQNLSDIGAKNAEFATSFLQSEGIACVGASLGGNQARRVRYWPDSGRAAQLKLEAAESVFASERSKPAPKPKVETGTVELF